MKNRNAVNDSSDYALVLELMSSSNLSETLHLQVLHYFLTKLIKFLIDDEKNTLYLQNEYLESNTK